MKWILAGVSSLAVLALVLSLSLTLGRGRNVENPVVETDVGTIRGLNAEDGDYSMYMGIPYALVNESNPFGLSIPHPKFEGIFDAFDDTAICPQLEELNNIITGTLDCLHLNIYVPNTASPVNRLSVLVWIHGGGFTTGSGARYDHGPKYLVRHDVILVTLNYRVGPYGFMCLGTPEVPGNQGFKDQMLAMKWIRDNIAAFNGDKDKITVMGESAGAMAIDFHVLSENERPYNQLILQSGSALLPFLVHRPDRTEANKIAAHLGFITDNLDEALSFLADVNPHEIIAATSALGTGVRLCLENEYDDIESTIIKHPEFVTPNVSDMKILSGFNSHERMIEYITLPPESFDNLTVFRDFVGAAFDISNDFDDMLDISRRFYIGDKEISYDVRWDLIDFTSDIIFNYPQQRSVVRFLESGASVYKYVFSYSGHRNFAKLRLNITEDGAAHADELGYLFDMTLITEEPTAEDQLMIDRITTMWTNFVKYGDPTPEVTDLLPVKWKLATKEVLNYINIDSELAAGTRPFHRRLAFWDLFYKTNYDRLVAHWFR